MVESAAGHSTMSPFLIRGGTVYDGRGGEPFAGDVLIEADRIAAVGRVAPPSDVTTIDARGLAVAPGFINMLSWAFGSLMQDGSSQSDIRQGVTLEVFGEGWSAGPYTEAMRRDVMERQGDVKYVIDWTTLGEGMARLIRRGISCNVASFVGAATVRIHELGYADRPPNAEELGRMRALVRQAMREGALGVGSALIYAPATFASTAELVGLASAAAEQGGMYISHIRNEGDRLLEAVDELIEVGRRAHCPAEIYHLKQAGRENWPKLDAVIDRVERARAAGQRVSADMYPYEAGATGLDAAMPPWVQRGGHRQWVERLRDPEVRAQVLIQMRSQSPDWENLLLAAGSADRVVLSAFKNPALKHLTGKTLAETGRKRGTSPEETAIDLVIEDDSRVGTLYFIASLDNMRRQVQLPWISFGSDAQSLAPEGVFLLSNPHPRAYGTFARVLAQYVRDDPVVSLAEAVRRLTSFPAQNLGLHERGWLSPGNYADVVVFDPERIQDHATYERPHQYATGVHYVFVNGVPVLRYGEHTGARPGRFVRRAALTAEV